MTATDRSYFEFIQACEALIREYRLAQQAGDREAMGSAYIQLLKKISPILTTRANQLRDISDGAVREAMDGMIDRLWHNINSTTFPTMESQFGAYLRSMPIRIVGKVREKYRPSEVSLQLEKLDEPVEAGQLPKSEAVADPRTSREPELAATRIDLQAALAQLSPVERLVAQRRLAGTSNNTIAEELGVSAATATRIYKRALEQLRPLLEGYAEGRVP
jgi:RNA polymerase sigma factor (sigma-70 family)